MKDRKHHIWNKYHTCYVSSSRADIAWLQAMHAHASRACHHFCQLKNPHTCNINTHSIPCCEISDRKEPPALNNHAVITTVQHLLSNTNTHLQLHAPMITKRCSVHLQALHTQVGPTQIDLILQCWLLCWKTELRLHAPECRCAASFRHANKEIPTQQIIPCIFRQDWSDDRPADSSDQSHKIIKWLDASHDSTSKLPPQSPDVARCTMHAPPFHIAFHLVACN